MEDFKFDLGQTLKDTITGYEGVVYSRSQWWNGCNTYGIKSRELKDGKPMDSVHFDEPQLKLVLEKHLMNPEATPSKKPGGPIKPMPQPNRS
jgi:hypothetical protein